MAAVEQNRLAHGYLFCGPAGVGAEAMAIELACAVNCEQGLGEPCGQCRHCRRIRALQHPDVHLLVPTSSAAPPSAAKSQDGISSSRGKAREDRRRGLCSLLAADPYVALPFNKNDLISVEDIRIVRKDASVKPYEGRKKVVVVVAADRMTAAAANALLKTLEEPPGSMMFVLTPIHYQRLPPTIISRCQPVHLARFPDAELLAALTKRYNIDPDEAVELSRRSEGRLSVALAAISERGRHLRDEAFILFKCINEAPPLRLFEKVEALTATHREEPVMEEIMQHLLELYRDLFVLLATDDASTVSYRDHLASIQALAKGMTCENIENGIVAIEEARESFDLNANVQLALLVLVLRLRRNQGLPAGDGPSPHALSSMD